MVDSKDMIKKGPWLVKSGDRISGPYSTDNLMQLIRDKEVVVIDEIMAPQSRWTYVRDVETFASVVEEMRRGLMNSREDTEVQGYTSPVQKSPLTRTTTAVSGPVSSATQTQTTTPTPTATPSGPVNLNAEDNDPTMVTITETAPDLNAAAAKKPAGAAPGSGAAAGSASPMSGASNASAATSGAQNIPGAAGTNAANVNASTGAAANQGPGANPAQAPGAANASAGAVKPPAKTLAMEPLSHHTKEIPKDPLAPPKQYVRPKMGTGRSGIWLGSLVLIVAASFIIYSVLKAPRTSSAVSGDSLQTQASVAWKRGEFDRALELYRALNHDRPGDPEVAARLATLLMKLEGQTVEAKRVIESARANAKDSEQKSALAVASGLAALQTDDAKAAVAEFSSATETWIASFDEGVAYTMMKDWSKAIGSFEHAGENAVALLMLARTHLSAGEVGAVPKVAARRQADEAIKKALLQAPDYQQESLLVASYVDAVSGNTKRALKEVLDAVETDPNQTSEHFHDPSLNLDQVSWTKLLPYCQGLHKELNTRVSGAMLGLCLAKANQIEDATKTVDLELSKDPSNTYLHAVNAYLHTLADRDDAARASLTLSTKNGNSRLAQILSARLCMREKQDECAEDGWTKLASENNPPIAAITGLAQLKLAKGDSSTANALLVKAESMSPKYLPLLRLREDASR